MSEPSNIELIARVVDPYVCTDALHHQLAAALRDAEAETTRLAQQIDAVRALLFDPIADYYGELRQKFEDIVSPVTTTDGDS